MVGGGNGDRRLASELDDADLTAVLDAARICAGASGLEALAEAAVAGLHRLISCDIAAYDEVDTATGAGWGCSDPPGAISAEGYEIFRAHATDNPLVVHATRAPDDVPRSWSELLPASELHRSELYNLLYLPLGVEYQMAACLETSGRAVAGLTLNRAGADFTDHDRALLDLYRRQLSGVRQLVVTSSRLTEATAATAVVVLVLDHAGEVVSLAVPGTAAVGEAAARVAATGLPEPLAGWVRARRAGPGPVREARWSAPGPNAGAWANWLPGPTQDLLVLPAAVLGAPVGDEPELWVGMLGGFSVLAGGSEVDLSGRTGEVVRLVAAWGGEAPVEAVIEALWPEADPRTGRRRLRTVLARLPHVGHRLLMRRGEAIHLAPEAVVDVQGFEAASEAALADRAAGRASWIHHARQALGIYRGDLLGRGPAADWALAPRERLRRRYLLLLDAVAAEADPTEALGLLERAIEADPGDESRYLRAAELLAGQGRRGAALAMLGRARAVLDDQALAVPGALLALEATLRR